MCPSLSVDPDVHEAAIKQSLIGWRNLAEGLPSRQWQLLQQRHYNRIGSCRTGHKWIKRILSLLKHALRQQWKHRNDIKHNKCRPRHKRMELELNSQIASELLIGPEDLPDGDRHHYDHNLVALIQKPLAFCQAWLVNISAAKQRQTQKRLRDDELVTISRKESKLLHWIHSGIAR